MSGWYWRGLGTLIGAAGGVGVGVLADVALDEGVGFGFLVLGGVVIAVLVLYLVGGRFVTPGTSGGELMPLLLVAFNTGINATILSILIHPALGVVLGVLLLLSIFGPVAKADPYQTFIGWANFLLPMSWLVTGLGLGMLLVSLLLHAVTIGRVAFLRVHRVLVDWKTGTFFSVGGLAGNANLNPGSPAYNMGNFAFLRSSAAPTADLIEHEAGHGLNLAAFGFVFHFIGAIDENVTGGGSNAYSELFAESNVPTSLRHGATYPMWGP